MGTDSLYYIMDYSGKYYRTNQIDQLVATASEQEATVFTFAQANSRIGIGKKSAFYCIIPVEEVSNTSIESKEESKADMEVQEQNETETDDYTSPVKELTYDELTEEVEKNVSSYDLSEMDWAEYLTHFIYLVNRIKDYRDELAKKHSDVEQKICDILHYIELCETDNDEAVDLVELLRVCRENRRDVKDELRRIEYFQTNLGTNSNLVKAKQALKYIKGLETRKYKPRKYDELFENCIMKERRLHKGDISDTQDYKENLKERFDRGQTIDDEGGEEIMTAERRYTPFDGKENDWLAFARQQAEFYRNAGQYISNLQLDIREIDDEIEDILCEAEDANCNVAQGYKVFKRLKELRLAKKAKSQELNCLYVMTDYIDCEALANTCEENLKEVENIMGESEKQDAAGVQKIDLQTKIQMESINDNIHDMVG